MNANRGRSSQPWGFTRCISPATDAGYSDCPHGRADVFVNPLDTLRGLSTVHTESYLHQIYRYPMRTTLYVPYTSKSTATSSQAPSVRKMSTQCIPPKLSSIPIPRIDTNSVPSKRAREYAPNASTLYRDPPAPPLRVQLLWSSSERATKRPRLDGGRSGTSPPSTVCANWSRVESKSGKVPRHPLAVDYSRPIQLVDPRPPRSCQSLARQNRMPLPPDPEIRDWKRLLDVRTQRF